MHLDAHTDSYGYDPNAKYNATTQFTHAAEEQCLVASLSYHIGIRGTTYVQGAFKKTRSLGYNIITLRELFARGFAEVLTELRERLKALVMIGGASVIAAPPSASYPAQAACL